jgi:tetratricopeptide (TPR) repeat protein
VSIFVSQAFAEFQATKIILKSLDDKEALSSLYSMVLSTHFEKGDLAQSQEDLQAWSNFMQKNWPKSKFPSYYFGPSFYEGLQALKEGRIDSAKAKLAELQAISSEIKGLTEEFRKSYEYKVDLLSSEILIAEGTPEKSIEVFNQAPRYGTAYIGNVGVMTWYNSPFLKDILARAYQQQDDLGKAIAEHERLTAFEPKNPERKLIHPLYYYRLGKLYEQKGNKSKARACYERFLDL